MNVGHIRVSMRLQEEFVMEAGDAAVTGEDASGHEGREEEVVFVRKGEQHFFVEDRGD
jgi:hypothetical protein